MQRLAQRRNGEWQSHEVPDPGETLMPGIRWGRVDQLFTPAFWAAQCWFADEDNQPRSYTIGETFREEVVACMLGGHGIRAEVALAAFRRLKVYGVLDGDAPTVDSVFMLLSRPLRVRARLVRYRFARRKSLYVSEFLQNAPHNTYAPGTDDEFRRWLLGFRGIGMKTASWITRNWRQSESVAIIDVHVHRAGLIAGLFQACDSIARDYLGSV